MEHLYYIFNKGFVQHVRVASDDNLNVFTHSLTHIHILAHYGDRSRIESLDNAPGYVWEWWTISETGPDSINAHTGPHCPKPGRWYAVVASSDQRQNESIRHQSTLTPVSLTLSCHLFTIPLSPKTLFTSSIHSYIGVPLNVAPLTSASVPFLQKTMDLTNATKLPQNSDVNSHKFPLQGSFLLPMSILPYSKTLRLECILLSSIRHSYVPLSPELMFIQVI